MSILVKGMEMPKNCAECLLLVNACSEEFSSYVCDVTGDDTLSIYEKPDWCPLVFVPTSHGRLVDIDAEVEKHDCIPILGEHLRSMVKHMTTVIESER